jgi:predicted alpha/beta superfamily hydrolase
MLRRIFLPALLVLLAVLPCAARAASLNAVEYFHAGFGHYFLTAEPDEVAALDAGTPPGWARTGYAFSVFLGPENGALPVCRLFSAAFAPRSSHFYTPFAAECASLRAGSTWTYESIAFHVALPSADGACPAGATTIYRLYNNGQGGAPNHRYTSLQAVVDSMVAQGWIAEGHGVTGAFACGPARPANESAVVQLTSSSGGLLYSVSIVVPAGHGPDSDPVPVIYALDAQFRYVPLLDVMQQTGSRAILVAIDDMTRRQTDFNMPGAIAYLAFLKSDLIPYVEANYRADPRKRVLTGLSTGGNFPIHALYLETPGPWTFAHYWSSEGAFWQQADVVAREEQEMYDRIGRSPFPVTLVLARGGVGTSTNSVIVRQLYDQIGSRNYVGLRLFDYFYPDFGHVPMDTPSFRDELGLLFSR